MWKYYGFEALSWKWLRSLSNTSSVILYSSVDWSFFILSIMYFFLEIFNYLLSLLLNIYIYIYIYVLINLMYIFMVFNFIQILNLQIFGHFVLNRASILFCLCFHFQVSRCRYLCFHTKLELIFQNIILCKTIKQ